MLVKMRYDSLIFVGLSVEQVESLEYRADKCTLLKDESGGVQVRGDKRCLYDLLFNLSVIYDIEIV